MTQKNTKRKVLIVIGDQTFRKEFEWDDTPESLEQAIRDSIIIKVT
jgi:hypothetical protein